MAQQQTHGLEAPVIGTDTGYFQVTFPGPGDNIERIRVPEKVGNVTFGGPGRDVLYIAASTSLYRIRLATRGVQRP